MAIAATRALVPFVDHEYRRPTVEVTVRGKTVHIPTRIHFIGLPGESPEMQPGFWPAVQCLCTRSTDGYQRQAALSDILPLNESWSIPFVVLLTGEYVVEIIDDIMAFCSALNRKTCIEFVRENRALMRLLRSKASSYWDCYYRTSYPNRASYPGLALLHQLEIWAS